MTLQLGETILNGRYRIEAFIGDGASAQVYRATHVDLQTLRALKVLRRDAPGMDGRRYSTFRQRFQTEAQLGARLDHRHIIRVYDFEQSEEMLAMAMEYAPGGSHCGSPGTGEADGDCRLPAHRRADRGRAGGDPRAGRGAPGRETEQHSVRGEGRRQGGGSWAGAGAVGAEPAVDVGG